MHRGLARQWFRNWRRSRRLRRWQRSRPEMRRRRERRRRWRRGRRQRLQRHRAAAQSKFLHMWRGTMPLPSYEFVPRCPSFLRLACQATRPAPLRIGQRVLARPTGSSPCSIVVEADGPSSLARLVIHEVLLAWVPIRRPATDLDCSVDAEAAVQTRRAETRHQDGVHRLLRDRLVRRTSGRRRRNRSGLRRDLRRQRRPADGHRDPFIAEKLLPSVSNALESDAPSISLLHLHEHINVIVEARSQHPSPARVLVVHEVLHVPVPICHLPIDVDGRVGRVGRVELGVAKARQ
mmetsp:Transcript_44148/g.127438  ORF Transcript_44148/g.127438 Transcript_44148/m.127438 type:complete len:292 (+) Transcript_44148:922-1797(+)